MSDGPKTYLRKVIHIGAEDSPNVQLGLAEQAAGLEPSGRDVVPGVLSWDLYQKRLRLWDPIMVCVGLKGQFWEGPQSLMYPPEWLNDSARVALQLSLEEKFKGIGSSWHRSGNDPLMRKARAGGCDPGEGGDSERLGTAWTIVDEYGVLEMIEERTADTSRINNVTKMLLRKWSLSPERFAYDRGGGGKQLADQLRAEGVHVKTVGFGESVAPDPKVGRKLNRERVEEREDKYYYPSRRCQMYHELRLAIDPAHAHTRLANIGGWLADEQYNDHDKSRHDDGDEEPFRRSRPFNRHELGQAAGRRGAGGGNTGRHTGGATGQPFFSQGRVFGIPGNEPVYHRLRQELALIPIDYDRDGRVILPPKHRDKHSRGQGVGLQSLCDIIGHSPDLADSLVLAYHMLGAGATPRPRAGGMRDRRREAVDYR
jgi:hypothetical protein